MKNLNLKYLVEHYSPELIPILKDKILTIPEA
jgi:hypothetical protein